MIQLKIEFADIFDEALEDGKIDIVRFFGLRDSYFEIVRNNRRSGNMSVADVLATCSREPNVPSPDIKAYAASMAKFYMHQFEIPDQDMPEWIEKTPACTYLTPFLVNASHLGEAVRSCPPEFLEKNVLVSRKDFQII